MVEADAHCPDGMKRVSAVRGQLDKAHRLCRASTSRLGADAMRSGCGDDPAGLTRGSKRNCPHTVLGRTGDFELDSHRDAIRVRSLMVRHFDTLPLLVTSSHAE
jgi:hypothetical protein